MDRICRHYLVNGRVQGVWYRATAKKVADKLGIVGWVRNVEGSQVEIVACAESDVLTEYELWLHKGPQVAKVKEIVITDLDLQSFDEFSVREDGVL